MTSLRRLNDGEAAFNDVTAALNGGEAAFNDVTVALNGGEAAFEWRLAGDV